jgi:two-component system sensor histidine kinase UhpB
MPGQAKSVEERLRACETRLSAIVQHTPHVSIQGFTLDGRVVFWNEASEHVFGWRAEEAIGKKLEQLIFSNAEGAAFVAMLQEIRQTKKPLGPREFRFDHRNGWEGWCLSTVFEIPGESSEPNFICMDVDITERKSAEKDVLASKELFAKAFCASPDLMSISDLETGRYIEINDVHARLLGFARHEIIGRSPTELGILEEPADYETFAHELRAHGKVRDFEIRAQNRQGKAILISISAELVQIGGRSCVLRVSRDVTDRKAAEQALRASEQRFRGYFEMGLVGMAIFSPEQGLVLFNDKLCEIFGYPRAEVASRTWTELTRPGDLASDTSMFNRVAAGEMDDYEIEKQLVHKDGRVVYAHILGKCLRETNGRVTSLVAMVQDITARKKAEEALRASEERFDLAVRGSNDALWDWNLRTNEVYHSPRFRELLRYEANEFPDLLESFNSHLHPDDFERTWNAIRAHLDTRSPYDTEYRLRTRDGQYRWFRSRGQAIWDADGNAIRMAGSLSEIHDRKIAEEALRQAQADALLARQEFTQRLISAQEQERKRLGGELHDSLGQNLSMIKNRIQLALSAPDLPSVTANHLEATSKLVSDSLTEVRNLAHRLRPLPIEQFGLTDCLETLIQDVAESSGIHFERRLEHVDELFPGEQATMIYRILQEALNNLVKHSSAKAAKITVERDLRSVRLKIEDNGRGFDVKTVFGRGKIRTGIGLTSIDERVRMLGGSLLIQSGPGQGTVLQIEVALSETAVFTRRDSPTSSWQATNPTIPLHPPATSSHGQSQQNPGSNS